MYVCAGGGGLYYPPTFGTNKHPTEKTLFCLWILVQAEAILVRTLCMYKQQCVYRVCIIDIKNKKIMKTLEKFSFFEGQ